MSPFDVLLKVLPEGLAPTDSGGVVLWVVALGALSWFARFVWKAYEDDIKARIKSLLATGPRGVFVAGWFAFVVYATVVQSIAMVGAAIVVMPLLAWCRYRWRLALPVVALVSVVAMAGALGYDRWQWNQERARIRVYFVLAFDDQNGRANDADVIDSWRDCKDILREVFDGISWLKVMPQGDNYETYRWGETAARRHVDLVKDRGVPADVVLRTSIAIYRNSSPNVMKVLPDLTRLSGDELVSLGATRPDEAITNRLEDRKYVSLAIASWLWHWLETQHRDRVGPSDAATVNKRIIERYGLFVESRVPPDPALLAKVRSAPPTDAAVGDLLRQYRPPIDVAPIADNEHQRRTLGLASSQAAKP